MQDTFMESSGGSILLLQFYQIPTTSLQCSIHYQRIHPEYWRDRLLRVKALGLNAIQASMIHYWLRRAVFNITLYTGY